MSAPQQMLTLSVTNQFTFNCPIFNADTKMASCLVLREKFWRGEPVAVRKGCQACMAGSKCPAAAIVTKLGNQMGSGKTPPVDAYGSIEPVKGKIAADILAPMVDRTIGASILDRYHVPLEERAMIESADERIRKQLGSAPETGKTRAAAKRTATAQPTPEAKPAVPDAIADAARTGDMSAAINAGDPK